MRRTDACAEDQQSDHSYKEPEAAVASAHQTAARVRSDWCAVSPTSRSGGSAIGVGTKATAVGAAGSDVRIAVGADGGGAPGGGGSGSGILIGLLKNSTATTLAPLITKLTALAPATKLPLRAAPTGCTSRDKASVTAEAWSGSSPGPGEGGQHPQPCLSLPRLSWQRHIASKRNAPVHPRDGHGPVTFPPLYPQTTES